MIFVLDSNVISEIMKPDPDPAVLEWLNERELSELYTTAVNQAEILYGIRRLNQGQRRTALESAAVALFSQEFNDRILAFDTIAASHCADIRINRERAGQPISREDSMIAGIVLACGARIVTRDQGGFDDCGIPIVNPWTYIAAR